MSAGILPALNDRRHPAGEKAFMPQSVGISQEFHCRRSGDLYKEIMEIGFLAKAQRSQRFEYRLFALQSGEGIKRFSEGLGVRPNPSGFSSSVEYAFRELF